MTQDVVRLEQPVDWTAFCSTTQASDGSALAHLRPPVLVSRANRIMRIDATTMRSLEIERTIRSGGLEGSLLSILQRVPDTHGTVEHCGIGSVLPITRPNRRSITAATGRDVATLLADEALVMTWWKPSILSRTSPASLAALSMRRFTPRDVR